MGIKLNMFGEKKYKVIKRINSGQQSKERGEVELDFSRRQINRLVNKYRKEGKTTFLHGNTNRKPATTIPNKIKKRILTLYRTNYKSFNVTHFVGKLNEDEEIKVSYTTVHRLLLDYHLLSPKVSRQTKRRKQKKLKVLEETKVKLTKQEVKTLNEIDGVNPLKAHPKGSRKKYFGKLLQMDASQLDWFKDGNYAHLQAVIDDTTGTVVGAYFDKEETLDAYYEISRQFSSTYGIPYVPLTDNRTVLEYKLKKNPSEEKVSVTQYGYAGQTLGIKLTTASIPETKGKIERL